MFLIRSHVFFLSFVPPVSVATCTRRCLTTQAQRPGPREAWIATGARWPGSNWLACAHTLGLAIRQTFAFGKSFSELPKPVESLQRMVRPLHGIILTVLIPFVSTEITS